MSGALLKKLTAAHKGTAVLRKLPYFRGDAACRVSQCHGHERRRGKRRDGASGETGQARRGKPRLYYGDYFSCNGMLARVFSQSRFIVQVLPDWSKPIVKFSTGEGVFETFMSARSNSSDSYL